MSTALRILFFSSILCLSACGSSDGDPDPGGTEGTGGVGGGGGGDDERDPVERGGTTPGARIQAALEAGAIDEKMAAYLRLLAAFAPSRLPDEFVGDVRSFPGHGVVAAAQAIEWLDEYGPTERAMVEAMLLPPSDPGFLRFPADDSDASGQVGLRSSLPTCDEEFVDARVGLPGVPWTSQTIETKYFTVKVVAPGQVGATEAAAIEKRLAAAMARGTPPGGKQIPAQPDFASYLDALYEYFRDYLMGEDADPIANISRRLVHKVLPTLEKGSDGAQRIRIELLPCDWANAMALSTGHIVLPLHLLEDDALRRSVVPHEIFHVFEFWKVEGIENHREGNWLIEATAVFVEHHLAPDVKRWSGKPFPGSDARFFTHMDRAFACPEEPFHASREGHCLGFERPHKLDRGDYGKFVFLEYLRGARGWVWPTFVRNLWNDLLRENGNPRPLFEEEEIAEFQLASVAERRSGTPYFEPGLRSSLEGLHYPESNPERWTLHVDAGRYPDFNYRATPYHATTSLQRNPTLEATLGPWGTHRWLIEVPAGVFPLEPWDRYPEETFLTVVTQKFGTPGSLRYLLAPLTPAGSGTSTVDLGGDFVTRGTELPDLVRIGQRKGEEKTAPQRLLVVVSNFSDQEVRYEAGVNIPWLCFVPCLGAFVDGYQSQGCTEWFCEKEYPDDQEGYDTCLQTFFGEYSAYIHCNYLCQPSAADGTGADLHEPYPRTVVVEGEAADFSLVAQAIYRSAGIAEDTWAGMTPIQPLPKLSCEEYLSIDP